ncbi:MAG: sugar phosphate nucleotidyltransferase [Sumerlaeia bacterium]
MTSSDSSPRAVVLCGGHGRRLRPYTTVLPKPLMPIGDRPILEIVLARLRDCGVWRVTLCVGYLAELIQSFFGDGSRLGLEIDYSFEEKPLGTIGPLAFVKDLGEDFLVLNGDVLTDLSPMAVFEAHRHNGADLTIATYGREVKIDFGVLRSDPGTGRVTEFVEKPVHRYEVSMGVYAVSARCLNLFEPGQAFGFDDLVLALLRENRPAVHFPHTGEWLDIGRKEDYERALDNPLWEEI